MRKLIKLIKNLNEWIVVFRKQNRHETYPILFFRCRVNIVRSKLVLHDQKGRVKLDNYGSKTRICVPPHFNCCTLENIYYTYIYYIPNRIDLS